MSSLEEVRGELIEVNRQLGEFVARLAAIDHEMDTTRRMANGALEGTNNSEAIEGLSCLSGSFAALHDTIGGVRMAREHFADYVVYLGRNGGGRA